MKKIIIILTTLLFLIFPSISYANIMSPGPIESYFDSINVIVKAIIFVFILIGFFIWKKKTIIILIVLLLLIFLIAYPIEMLWSGFIILIKSLFVILFRKNKALGLKKINNKRVIIVGILSSFLGIMAYISLTLVWSYIERYYYYSISENYSLIIVLIIILFITLLESILYNKLLPLKYSKSLLLSSIINGVFMVFILINYFN